jgi:hypothetical protein
MAGVGASASENKTLAAHGEQAMPWRSVRTSLFVGTLVSGGVNLAMLSYKSSDTRSVGCDTRLGPRVHGRNEA